MGKGGELGTGKGTSGGFVPYTGALVKPGSGTTV
jgi:hypothetical protein